MLAGIIIITLSRPHSRCLFLYLLPMHIKTTCNSLPPPPPPPSGVTLCTAPEAFHFLRCRHFSNQMRKQCKTRGQKFPLKCNRCKLEVDRKKGRKDRNKNKSKKKLCIKYEQSWAESGREKPTRRIPCYNIPAATGYCYCFVLFFIFIYEACSRCQLAMN